MPVIPYFDDALALLDDALASDEPPPPSEAAASSQSAAAPPKASPTVVEPAAAAAFLLRCAKTPQRFFYPCNAKAREPVTCVYRFQRGVARGFGPGPAICEARVFECAYDAGGTGWRAWPSALLLACWCAEHYGALGLTNDRARVCELGCGLGLPGLAAAALGAADVTLTDCLPRLLATVRESAQATAAANGGRAPAVSVLDWDVEAPPDAAAAAEAYSTEQGVRSAQRRDDDDAAEAPLAADARFDVLLATDVIYSRAHAAQLPAVVARRLAPGGRLCAMVPVRSEGDARTFGRLQRIGADVRSRASPPSGAPPRHAQRGEAPGGAARAEAPYEAGTALQEGEVVFVEAVIGR